MTTTEARVVQGVNPRTGRPTGAPIPETGAEEVEALLAAAAAAAPEFGRGRPSTRAGLLRALADRLDERAGDIVPLAVAESGLPEARLTGEVARTSGQLRLFASVLEDGDYLEVILDPADPSSTPPRPDLRRWLEPLGPVLVYAASNFPFAFSVLGGDTASALAAGTPVIVKAHPSHPGLSQAIADLAAAVVAESHLPSGVFAIVHGDEAGLTLLRDSRVKACGFTGSTAGGRFLFDAATSRPDPIPFYGELGSINPAVVTPAAVAARGAEIAQGFVASMSLGAGQFCTKPGLLFLPSGHGLDATLAEAVSAGPPAPMLNARISTQLAAGLAELGRHPAVEPVAEGATPPAEGAWCSPRLFRTTAAALRGDPAALTSEYFGPNALVVEYRDADDLRAALAAVEGSLTATVHSEPGEDFPVRDVVGFLAGRAGRVLHNGWPTGVAVTWSMQHGGPWPASTNSLHTSVGATAIRRWLRPVCYQDLPAELLPEALTDDNPWELPRRVDGLR
jgi:NADP-dependent aldehyde dehydrogenase